MKKFKDLTEGQEFKFLSKVQSGDHVLRKVKVWMDHGTSYDAYQYVEEVPYTAKIIAFSNLGDRDVLQKVTKTIEVWE